ncbi:MAG: P-type ATPase [Nitrospira sp.]
MSVATARVIRGGALQSIPARELVTGDVVALEAGDRIPADARLFYTTNFQAQEASLTGESTPVQAIDATCRARECVRPCVG